MTITVQSAVSNKGLFEATITIAADTNPASIEVGHLEDVTIQVVRTGSTDSLAVTGNCGGASVAVTSTQQVATGGDTALTAVTAGVHTIRQRVKTLTFTASGSTDTFTIYIVGRANR